MLELLSLKVEKAENQEEKSDLPFSHWKAIRLVKYYQRFVEGFSLITAPLMMLLRKNTPFKWTDD
ncbi:RNA-directed DNA polymerase-like protein [Gossypium australe]|uniref:RNA-directed DNA polymerase-like protein n=1 Tax=Gossypium australe TaxID=47621 RepID=A0A5B6WUS5_9ROSI|nr:RNA-directed DNA polymerase-like protein [Gossypium australe]